MRILPVIISISLLAVLAPFSFSAAEINQNIAAPRALKRPGVKLPANLIRLPLVRQATDYTCGVAALQSVLAYYGEDFREEYLSKKLKANFHDGTAYSEMANFSRKQGFHVDINKKMSLADLKATIDKKLPVILCIQAWGDGPGTNNYRDEWNDGHYVVAAGYDEENIYFMDPSTIGNYAYIPAKELLERWHDTDGKERLCNFGMIISRDKSNYTPDIALFME
jgi:predicted double-glycine peptidase